MIIENILIEKSRECHNHKRQPTHDTKRREKMAKPNTSKINKQTNAREALRPAPLPQARWSQRLKE